MARVTMFRKFRRAAAVAMLPAAALVACSIGSTEEDRPRPEDPGSFVDNILEDARLHDWQSILSSSDPNAYESRVVAAEIPEVQFLAELLGLLRDDNTIQDGPELDWEDLARIDSIAVAPATDTIPPVHVAGTAFLESGERLQVETEVVLVQGRFVLTPSAD